MRVKKLMQAGYFRQRPIVLDGMKSAGLFPMASVGRRRRGMSLTCHIGT